MKEVMLVTGAGQISMAIARRVGYGKKIVLDDKNSSQARLSCVTAVRLQAISTANSDRRNEVRYDSI